ncbi:zinc finger protein OZF-like [Euwallacea fornicatus]|uniref:zinc finger protein OZF-like n=1 Tax=Euwallacea fornicatus TaxID=995702 RepID=UPI00338E13FC
MASCSPDLDLSPDLLITDASQSVDEDINSSDNVPEHVDSHIEHCSNIKDKNDNVKLPNIQHEKVCRICLYVIIDDSYFQFNSRENTDHLENLIQVCLPNVNLNLVTDPLICKKCFECLEEFYNLSQACIKIERELQDYCNISQGLVTIDIQDFLKYSLKNKISVFAIKEEQQSSDKQLDPNEINPDYNTLGPDDVDVKSERDEMDWQPKRIRRKRSQMLHRARTTGLPKVKKKKKTHKSEISPDLLSVEIKCEICERKFATKWALDRHLPVHCTNSSSTNYYCESCNVKFKYKHSYYKHLDTHFTGETKEKPFACECGKSFNRNAKLKRHQLIHVKKERPFACKDCGKRFIEQGMLDGHVERVHVNEKPYGCPECGNRYTSKAGLDVHSKSHQPEGRPKPEPDLMCDICGKLFYRKYGLEKHRMSHTGDKPHECDQCEMKFKERYQLTIHMRRHTGEKPFECEICGFRFSCRNRLNVHMRRHTGVRPFPCHLCEMAFTRNDHLIKHIRAIHTGERPFECDICHKTFNRKDYLLKHHKVHLKNSL